MKERDREGKEKREKERKWDANWRKMRQNKRIKKERSIRKRLVRQSEQKKCKKKEFDLTSLNPVKIKKG